MRPRTDGADDALVAESLARLAAAPLPPFAQLLARHLPAIRGREAGAKNGSVDAR